MSSLKKITVYMNMARELAKLSKDEQTQVGALVISKNGKIIGGGYNGFLWGADDKDLPKTREGGKHEFIQHAERNTIYNCVAENICTEGSTIICTLSPCLDCLRACHQSKVKWIVYDNTYPACSALGFYENLADVVVTKKSLGQYTILELSPVVGDKKWEL